MPDEPEQKDPEAISTIGDTAADEKDEDEDEDDEEEDAA